MEHWKIFLSLYAIFFLPLDILLSIFPPDVEIFPNGMEIQKFSPLDIFLGISGVVVMFSVFAFLRFLTTKNEVTLFMVFAGLKENFWKKIITLLWLFFVFFLFAMVAILCVLPFAMLKWEPLVVITGVVVSILALVLSFHFSFSLQISCFRDIFGRKALEKSVKIVRHRVLSLFGMLLSFVLLMTFAMFVGMFFVSLVFLFLGIPEIFLRFFSLAVDNVMGMIFAVYTGLLYIFFEVTQHE